MVVDRRKSSPKNASPLRSNDENVLVDQRLAHSQSAHWDNHILFLTQHQKAFEGVFQEGLIFGIFLKGLIWQLPE